MGRFVVVTKVASVVDNAAVLTAEAAQPIAEANITLGGDANVVAKAITGSQVRGATSETNASLISKTHGPPD